MRSKFKLEPLPAEGKLAGFLLLEPCWHVQHASMIARRALGLYAVFMACNKVRKGSATFTADVWQQCLKEGAVSSKVLSDILGQLWT